MNKNLPTTTRIPWPVRFWLWLFPGSVYSTTAHRWVYFGLATVLAAAQLVGLVQGEISFDQYLVLASFWVSLVATGFHAIAGGLIYTLFFAVALLTDHHLDVSILSALGLYAIAVDWISRLWIAPAGCLLFFIESVWFAQTGDLLIQLPMTLLGISASVALGLALRWQREHLAKAKAESAANLVAAENARRLVRRELAVELHDTLAKDLARIAITAQRLAVAAPGDTTPTELAELAELTSTAGRRLRPLILDLDATGRDAPLSQVIETCATMLHSRQITLAAEVPGNIDIILTQQQRILFGLVLREAATNVLKYAPAKSVANLKIEINPPGVIDLIMTNSVALAPVTPAVTGGFGLVNLAERVAAESGILNFGRNNKIWVLAVTLPPTSNLLIPNKESDE